MKVKQRRLLDVETIADRYVDVKSAKVAYLFARNKTIISGPLGDMRKVTKATPAIEEFNKARSELNKEYADKDDDGAPRQEIDKSTGVLRYSISRIGALSMATEKLLNTKYPQAKIDQEEIEKKSRELLEEEIDVPFYCMELTKIPGFRNENDDDNGIIAMGDLAVLLELGIVYEKAEEEDDNVVELDKKKAAEEKSKAADVN